MLTPSAIKLAVIGLGYVGLPLAVEFGKKRSVVGFDINQPRINALKAGHDTTLEVSDEELAEAKHLSYTGQPRRLERLQRLHSDRANAHQRTQTARPNTAYQSL